MPRSRAMGDVEAEQLANRALERERIDYPNRTDNEVKDLQSRWRHYVRWCNDRQIRGREVLGIGEDRMAEFIRQRLQQVKSGPEGFSKQLYIISATFKHHGKGDPLRRSKAGALLDAAGRR